MRIQRGGQGVRTPPPLKISQKYRVSKQYWSGPPGKSQNYKASIQCRAIIGPPAKRHFQSAIQMAFRWRADDGPLIVVSGFFLPLIKKKKRNKKERKKRCQSWTPSDKTFWIRACYKKIPCSTQLSTIFILLISVNIN